MDDIDSILTLVTEPAVPLICEPAAKKRAPDSSYGAQFSLPYGVACCLTRNRFGLEEIEEKSYTDPALLKLAAKVGYEIDPNSGFPKFRSGEVIVNMRNGQSFRQREAILPDEPAGDSEIVDKFMLNVEPLMDTARAEKIRDTILALEKMADTRVLLAMLSGSQR